VISVRKISLGGGFRYLMDSVALGDGAIQHTNALSRYYAVSGTPPGRFVGAGLGDLGIGNGEEVSEKHLTFMLGSLAHPVTGAPIGSAPRSGKRTPVAGFDLTFSPSKSVSVAWAMADEGTKAIIYQAHLDAISETLAYAERNVLRSRSGTDGVSEEEIIGVVAASFTHWTSRSGTPQLHNHVVVWNRARSTADGKWRTLDSRSIFRHTVAMSEMHQRVLSTILTERLGYGWTPRARKHSAVPKLEITGISTEMIATFSKRTAAIESANVDLIASFEADHGRAPTSVEVLRLRQWATLATRPAKQHSALADKVEHWTAEFEEHFGDRLAFVATLADRNDLPALRADDFDDVILADAAGVALHTVAERKATFTRANLWAEAERQLAGVRFATVADGNAVVERVIHLATEEAVCLTPTTTRHAPARYRRADGTSRLRPESHRLFTSQTLIDAEARLLEAGRRIGAPGVPTATVAQVCDTPVGAHHVALSLDQALAVEKIATSRRQLDVLVGPAGTGKSVTMAGLRAAWEAEHGAASVVGLAPSAAAAEVLSTELGLDAENTAKWLHEYRQLPTKRDEMARLRATAHDLSAGPQAHERIAALEAHIAKWTLRPGQLVIVDEASLAGTFAMDELVSAAGDAGAKVVLVGDWGQLSSVTAGGAFGLVARDRGETVAELTDIRRFVNPWEKRASIALRLGDTQAIEEYQAHGRIESGTRDELLDAVYQSWRADIAAGMSSLMIAADTATVAELNARARADRVVAGHVEEVGLELSGAQTAGVGDEVVTRQNDRRLLTGKHWVKNGDRWTVQATHADGSMTVARLGSHGAVVLPADYVTEHVELAYATTAHRAQGRTVDTSHAVVSPTTTREVLYVSATRGRESNRLYVDTAYDPDPQTSHGGLTQPQSAEEVLTGVLRNEGADLSAHETAVREDHRVHGIEQLAREYQTLSREAQADRWAELLTRSIRTPYELDLCLRSEALGPLMAALRDAEARGVTVDTVLPDLVSQHSLADAEDVAAVLHSRLTAHAGAKPSRRQQSADLVVGLFPRPKGVTDPDMAKALDERTEALEARARMLATEALENHAPWTQAFGMCPVGPMAELWLDAVATVAAYRERWDVTSRTPLGAEPKSIEGIGHKKRARAALERAVAVTQQATRGYGIEAPVLVPTLAG